MLYKLTNNFTELYTKSFLSLKNLSQDMEKPCVLDIKLGSKPYNPAKWERQKWKASISTSSNLGFRLCGFSYYNSSDYKQFINKYACR